MKHRAIIGREVPLRALEEALAAPPRVVLVSGEAGIGKTRLVEAIVTRMRARGARIITGHCYPSDTVFAFSPWIEGLRSLVGDEPLLARLGAPWRAELAELVPELGAPQPPIAPRVRGGCSRPSGVSSKRSRPPRPSCS